MPTTQNFSLTRTDAPVPMVPVSGVAPWVTAIAAEGLTVVDSGVSGDVLIEPRLITDSSRRLLVRPAYGGTNIWLRKAYNSEDLQSAVLRVRVFAATDAEEPLWTVLHNLRGQASVEISNSEGDPFGFGSAEPTPPRRTTITDATAHVWDGRGFSHFLIGVEVTYAVSGGGDSDEAVLQARMV